METECDLQEEVGMEMKSRPFARTSLLWVVAIAAEVLMYGIYGILVNLSMVNGEIPYLTSSFVFSTELLKLVICLIVLWPAYQANQLSSVSFYSSLPFALPALCYCANNNLAVFMQTQMDPATYMVLGNLKILTTAFLYRSIIKKPISIPQWFSIGLLTCGGIINSTAALKAKTLNLIEIHITWLGLFTLGCYCFISGFAGVFTEYILKKDIQQSVYLQNALLYAYGASFSFIGWAVQAFNTSTVSKNNQYFFIFHGYSASTWILIITQAATGLIMSLIMKHTSNIVRIFIIASAPLITTALSYQIFNLQIHAEFVVSASLITIAVALYQYEKDSKTKGFKFLSYLYYIFYEIFRSSP